MTAIAKDPFENILELPVVNRGAWLATASGGHWSLEHPSPADVRFKDIAIGLSRTCRYGGQLREDLDFYAVTEHSDLMTDWAIDHGVARTLEQALSIKLHDAAEFVFGDMQTPLKKLLPSYKAMENAALETVIEAFGLLGNPHALDKTVVKTLDNRIFLDESEALLVDPGRDAKLQAFQRRNPGLSPLGVDLRCLTPRAALVDFTAHFIGICEDLPAADPAWRERIEPFIDDAKNLLERVATDHERATGPQPEF